MVTTRRTAASTRRTIDPHAVLCDEEIAKRALSGDARAFGALMARHGARIYRLALRILSNPSDAEDATQDTFLSAYRSLATFNGEAKFSTWLHRIGVNAALMRRRAARRRPTVSLDDAPSLATEDRGSGPIDDLFAPSPDDDARRSELERELSLALLTLDERYRAIFVLRDLDGISTQEAANKLGLSAALARQRLHRARMALRDLVAPFAPGAERATRRVA